MWDRLFDRMLTHLIRESRLIVTLADGATHSYGDPAAPAVQVNLTTPDLPRRICLNPDMAVGEGYMNGTLTIGDDDLSGFLTTVIRNIARRETIWFQRPLAIGRKAMRRLRQWNPVGRAQRNIAHHYDLSGDLYRLFLDEDQQYSCAYFRHPDDTLEQAQAQKKAHIAAKLLIEPGMQVLDIGCGWGGMALTLARDYGAQVTGVTLSREQHSVATRRAQEAGLSDKVQFRLQDYRLVPETFDRIVSVGMFEHVGVPHYREYFRHIRRMLAPDGVALIHTIGRNAPPGATSPFIDRYVFPGGYVPAMSEALTAVEFEGLHITDVEVWRQHYAETLKHWSDRFETQIDKATALYDDRFCRMWRYYLRASELTFRYNRQVVFQFQLSANMLGVPLTRDYMYPAKAAGTRQ